MPVLDQAKIGVLGAGAMGSGIAQVAAAAGHRVVIADASAVSLEKGRDGISKAMAREVEKGRLTSQAAGALRDRIRFETAGNQSLDAFSGCDLVIEAIVEDLGAKQLAFRSLEKVVGPECVLATNTSSLSVAAIASACEHPRRVIGLHFFNPAPVLPLVEVVRAIASDPEVVGRARALVDHWGKVTVLTRDTPGFIVNRVARPFYGEALRIHDEHIADVATIDWAMKEFGGFRMGPFELMDLIGNDVNYAVTASVFEAMGYDPRYRPSITQRRMVEAGLLGRKTRVGYYDYRDGARKPEPTRAPDAKEQIFDRILAMLINEAADAILFHVASATDIDLAMTKGVNYPKGLLAWGDELGAATIFDRLVALQERYGEDRYRPSAILRQAAREGRKLNP